MVTTFAPLRPTGAELTEMQADTYAVLKGAMPGGFTRPELVARLGDTAPSRVGELRNLGADIPKETRHGKAYYRLASLAWKTPDPVELGVKARAGAASGLDVSLYAECKGKLAPEVEARLLARIRAAMEEALATLCPGVKNLHPSSSTVQKLHSQDAPYTLEDEYEDPEDGYDEDLDLDAYAARFRDWNEED